MDVDEAFRLIDAIDETLARKVLAASISPEVFTTLDDINAGRREIEGIASRIDDSIRLRLKAIASSVYVGTLRRGNVACTSSGSPGSRTCRRCMNEKGRVPITPFGGCFGRYLSAPLRA